MRIAIVGGGISGLVAAHLLHREHDITLFEAGGRVGGHSNTVDVDCDGRRWSVDTGFIVYNERNYPCFTTLLRQLGVATQPSTMSFSVRCDRSGLEYNGSTLRQLFVQPRNALRPSFYRMLADILRFNREAPLAMRNGASSATLGEYLDQARYSRSFIDHYLVPMGSALWSVPRGKVFDMPGAFFVRFFENHGMLQVNGRPEWRVVRGGSARYVEALTASFRHRVVLNHPVRAVARHRDHVTVDRRTFDHVILACHSDQALAMLADPTPAEREILGALPYQPNDVVLHTDTAVLPTRRRAWAAWNYRIRGREESPAVVTYNMNMLQSLDATQTFCVTLNSSDEVDPNRVLSRVRYHHPIFSDAGFRAQGRHAEISGTNRTHYCGAYWGYGFHEDGVRSAVGVCRQFGARL